MRARFFSLLFCVCASSFWFRIAAGVIVILGWRSSMAEHLFCKQVVRGSSPLASSVESRNRNLPNTNYLGGLPEWPKGADCKSAGYAFDGSNPSPSTASAGVAQLVERQPSKLNVAGSNPVSRSTTTRPPSSVVEHFLGKEEVTGSSPVVGSTQVTRVRGREGQRRRRKSWPRKNSSAISPM